MILNKLRFYISRNNLNLQKKALRRIEKKKPKFYCLNDDQRDNPNPEVVDLVQDFLNRMYPEKSEFEI